MNQRRFDNYIRTRDGGICVYCRDAVGTDREHVKDSNFWEFVLRAILHLISVREDLSYIHRNLDYLSKTPEFAINTRNKSGTSRAESGPRDTPNSPQEKI